MRVTKEEAEQEARRVLSAWTEDGEHGVFPLGLRYHSSSTNSKLVLSVSMVSVFVTVVT